MEYWRVTVEARRVDRLDLRLVRLQQAPPSSEGLTPGGTAEQAGALLHEVAASWRDQAEAESAVRMDVHGGDIALRLG